MEEPQKCSTSTGSSSGSRNKDNCSLIRPRDPKQAERRLFLSRLERLIKPFRTYIRKRTICWKKERVKVNGRDNRNTGKGKFPEERIGSEIEWKVGGGEGRRRNEWGREKSESVGIPPASWRNSAG